MLSLLQSGVDSSNHVEIIFGCDGDNKTGSSFTFHIPKDMLHHAIAKCTRVTRTKACHRFCKEYQVSDTVYETNEEQEIRVYKKETLDVGAFHDHVVVYSHKTKLSPHNFPSSLDMHAISYVHTTTLKLHNRVHVVAEERVYQDECEAYNKLSLVYMHDDDVDNGLVCSAMSRAYETIVNTLQSAPTSGKHPKTHTPSSPCLEQTCP
jgi:hypothetical protein